MKNPILHILFFVIFFMSCEGGGKKGYDATSISEVTKGDSVYKSRVTGDKSDGNSEIEFTILGSLDIMNNDAGILNAAQAQELADKIGWRLPTIDELNIIYDHSEDKAFGRFSNNYYLAMDYVSDEDTEEGEKIKVISRKSFVNGEEVVLQTAEELGSIYGIRLVRDHISR